MKKLFIETYGCQMNVADSEVVASVMQMAGYETVEDIEEADAEVPREALVDKFERRHVSADNSLLAQEVIGGYLAAVLP